jgi:hypothetical protein
MEKQYNTESLGDFADMFYANKVEATALEVDKILWRGANDANPYAVVTGNLLLCSGFLQVGYDLSASTINIAKTGITKANGYVIVDDIITQAVAGNAVLAEENNIYLSPADYQAYLQSLRTLNLFHYDITTAKDITSILHPGSMFQVIPVHGLNGSNRIFIGKKSNFFIGTDLVSDYSGFKLWWSQDNQEVRMKCQFRIGAQTGVDQIISNNLA